MSQEDLASRLDRDISAVGRLERGMANPTYESLLGLAQGLEVELSTVMKRAEELRDHG